MGKEPPFEQEAEGLGHPIGDADIRIEVSPGTWKREPLVLRLDRMLDAHPVVVVLDAAAAEQGLVLRRLGDQLIIDRATDVEYVDGVSEVVTLTPMTDIQRRARLIRHARGLELVQRAEAAFAEWRDDFRKQLTGAIDEASWPVKKTWPDDPGAPAPAEKPPLGELLRYIILEDDKRMSYEPMRLADAKRIALDLQRAHRNRSYHIVRLVGEVIATE